MLRYEQRKIVCRTSSRSSTRLGNTLNTGNAFPPSSLPLQDEFAPGYIGRLIGLSLAEDGEAYFKDLRARLAQQDVDLEGKYNEELLVHVHGLTHQDFIEKHSLIPYSWAVRAPLPSYRSNRRTRPASISNTPRNGAWFCPDCARQDRQTDGVSYWRRTHQLTGIEKCLFHRNTCLLGVDSKSAFMQEPYLFLDRGAPTEYCRSAVAQCDTILRFAEISAWLLNAPHPKPPKAARALMSALTSTSGIYGGKFFAASELLRHATEVLPKEWLAANFPDVFERLSWRCSFSYKATADFALALALVTKSASMAQAHWQTLP